MIDILKTVTFYIIVCLLLQFHKSYILQYMYIKNNVWNRLVFSNHQYNNNDWFPIYCVLCKLKCHMMKTYQFKVLTLDRQPSPLKGPRLDSRDEHVLPLGFSKQTARALIKSPGTSQEYFKSYFLILILLKNFKKKIYI